ncbi:DUF4115 domain-containing protein [Streptomyces sp. NA04227]|uniref:RodZ domain-containing protein n=1 Tax=Streptomyces sp. NA04227 TaxID=2742136 RepID=UPI001592629B|nr:RodZ domain-containing protein [Streptomyces sp. NA04227]QKW06167.1 DUF4115 domain-containing protein [Streptomyces sp. NA04227]
MGFDSDLPQRIGGYAVERKLGAGGMGTVYLARSPGGRAVAVKVARSDLAGDPHFRARFRAEIEAARKVGGFHTAPVVDADPDADAPWLATAYIPGPTLSGLLAGQGPMDEDRLRQLGAALAEALQAIHACGLVHRDLKPGNIIMAEDGPRVLDFGIARAVESTRITSTGTTFGTPGYLAPEQAQGSEVSGAADVFALGAVLVSAAGGSAFGTGAPMGLMYRSVHEPADLSAVPEALRPLVAACLSKDPGARPTPDRLLRLLLPGGDSHEATVVVRGAPGAVAGVGAVTPPGSGATNGPGGSGTGGRTDGGGTDAPDAARTPTPVLGDTDPNSNAPTVGPGLADSPPAWAEHRDATPVPPTAPPPGEQRGRRPGRSIAMALAAAAATGALIGGAVYLTQQDGGNDNPSASSPKPPSASVPSSNSSDSSDSSESPGSSGSSDASPSSPSSAAQEPGAQGKVTVQVSGAEQQSWVSAKNSAGRMLFDGLLGQGETKTFTDTKAVNLVLGDASAVRLVVNGKEVPNEFTPGQVERLVFTKED